MGKGARIRAERRAAEAAGGDGPDVVQLAEVLQQVSDAGDFERLVEARSDLFDDSMLALLRDMASNEEVRPFMEMFLDLVVDARDDPRKAWSAYQEALADGEREARQLQPQVDRVDQLVEHRHYEEAIELGEDALAQALALGQGVTVAQLHMLLAQAFRLRTEGDPAANIDAAIDHTNGVIAAPIDLEERVKQEMNLAVLLASRKNGDPAENFENALGILRSALEQLEGSDLNDLRATVQTNLAYDLHIRERGDRRTNLLEARDLCLAALDWRSLERNPIDWAYSKVNLGAIYDDLQHFGDATHAQAETELLDVIDAHDRIGDLRLIGLAHGSLGASHRRAAERIAEAEDRAVVGPGKPPPPGTEETAHLNAAREHLSTAIALLDPTSERDEWGRALADLGAIEESADNEDEAIDAYRRGLPALRPNSMPRECARAGWALGNLLALRGEWEECASAFSAAVAAAEFRFHARLETADRMGEVERAGNLARWAAFALAKTGNTDAAVLVLENGRTRELRRRLEIGVEEELIDQLPPEARADYQEAVSELSGASLAGSSDPAGRRLQEVLTAIRELPGFERFAMGTGWRDLERAVEPDWPLIYVNPTPYGTVFLSVIEEDGVVRSAVRFVDGITSHDVFMALMFGDLSGGFPPCSFLGEASGMTDPSGRFEIALQYVLQAIGEWVARPLAEFLADLDVPGATLVLCGPLSLAPLGAATWGSSAGTSCLMDGFELRQAPSGTMQAACAGRSHERGGRTATLTALGNPDLGDPEDDLPASEVEVDEIANHFGNARVSIATRGAATGAFLRANAPTATHVHLACHGKGGLLDPDEAGLDLADGVVPATELAAMRLEAQLTVMSACETAISEIARQPHEVFSLSTAFLAAGSAGVVATLWSIDDAATALLMTRFYEEMFEGHRTAPQALRRAQLWLRDLDEDKEAEYLVAHPALAAEFQRRRKEGRRPGRRGSGGPVAVPRPYSAPEFWAPFVAFGS